MKLSRVEKTMLWFQIALESMVENNIMPEYVLSNQKIVNKNKINKILKNFQPKSEEIMSIMNYHMNSLNLTDKQRKEIDECVNSSVGQFFVQS